MAHSRRDSKSTQQAETIAPLLPEDEIMLPFQEDIPTLAAQQASDSGLLTQKPLDKNIFDKFNLEELLVTSPPEISGSGTQEQIVDRESGDEGEIPSSLSIDELFATPDAPVPDKAPENAVLDEPHVLDDQEPLSDAQKHSVPKQSSPDDAGELKTPHSDERHQAPEARESIPHEKGEHHMTQEVEGTIMTDMTRTEDRTGSAGEGSPPSAGPSEGQPNPLLMEKPRLLLDGETYLAHLWESNPDIYELLTGAGDLESAREGIFSYLDGVEKLMLGRDCEAHALERNRVREAVEVVRNVFAPIHEELAATSALDILWKLANERTDELQEDVTVAFILEFIHLFRAVTGNSHCYGDSQLGRKDHAAFLDSTGRDAALLRSESYEDLAESAKKHFKKYPSGMEDDVIAWRRANINRIIKHFKGDRHHWGDYHWHLQHLVRDVSVLGALVELSEEQKEVLKTASESRIPIAITPYYMSLMDRMISIGLDHAIRARIIPPRDYAQKMSDAEETDRMMKASAELETSPVRLVNRRQPVTALVKPCGGAPQSLLYCQRRWEIEECCAPDMKPMAGDFDMVKQWLEENPGIEEIMLSGGDLIMQSDGEIAEFLGRLAEFRNIHRLCIDTRTPVTLPMRWTDELLDILETVHRPGVRQLAILTHFEQSYEITPDAAEAVQKIRRRGMEIYNQHIMSVENSRRFEICKLRRDLSLIGVTPLWSLNSSGEDASRIYMVPVARILQEQREEACLLPAFTWTDRPLSHMPGIGTHNLDARQDRMVIMIKPDGARVYEFHSRQRNIQALDPCYHTDIPIYDYLQEMSSRGENPWDYRNIWFYY